MIEWLRGTAFKLVFFPASCRARLAALTPRSPVRYSSGQLKRLYETIAA